MVVGDPKNATVVEQVDTQDLKSCGQQCSCRFDPGQQYETKKKMKKLFFIAAMVTLAACSNETSTTSKDSTCTDSTCVDSTNVDSLIKSTEAHADSLHAEIEDLKK